ncbi:MAG: type IV-A pilus assembly ATPase PilB [Bdellovibrionales bacterium CG10_big_fil_rev_8_21_14_0_10_45_34]|nr:MAG: type IV-A pilus assembly ATPase PilB [Bdellovibrionales bacterium CG10_big_fil_rev_8_21_14_0_10_45_34]
MAAKNLGELLVTENVIGVDQLEQAKKEQRLNGGRLGAALVKLGHINDKQLAEFLSKQYQVPSIDLNNFEIDHTILKTIPKEVCEKYSVIPIQKAGSSIVVAMADPGNLHARDDLAFLLRAKIEVVVASEKEINQSIERYYGGNVSYESIMTEIEQTVSGGEETAAQVEIVDVDRHDKDSPIIKFVNLMLTEAINMRASDIHIEPYEKRMRVRFRIDGVLYEKVQPPQGIATALSSRIKVMAKLDISEKRRPQDGRIKINIKGKKEMDFRVSVLPTVNGEKIVLRLLDQSNLQLDMSLLGFEPDEVEIFTRAIFLPNGMVLITGPTGSGKTTTIYSALATLNTTDRNISTAEDPVEFRIDGINQVQMNADVELNFASALRSFLRQDPDIIMVGEIRDYETADIAFKAALTGHLVVSTLHTNDAPQTVNRLLNMGFEPFLVSSAINLIVAQRLVRRICPKCKVPEKVEDEILLEMGFKKEEIGTFEPMKGVGCEACSEIGYKGRVAVYEMLEFSEAFKSGIFQNLNPSQLKTLAMKSGMRSMRQSGLLKIKAGATTVEEVLETTVRDEVVDLEPKVELKVEQAG